MKSCAWRLLAELCGSLCWAGKSLRERAAAGYSFSSADGHCRDSGTDNQSTKGLLPAHYHHYKLPRPPERINGCLFKRWMGRTHNTWATPQIKKAHFSFFCDGLLLIPIGLFTFKLLFKVWGLWTFLWIKMTAARARCTVKQRWASVTRWGWTRIQWSVKR